MDNKTAIWHIKEYMLANRLADSKYPMITEALNRSIKALENEGCGCSICLIHNDMKCPRMESSDTIEANL